MWSADRRERTRFVGEHDPLPPTERELREMSAEELLARRRSPLLGTAWVRVCLPCFREHWSMTVPLDGPSDTQTPCELCSRPTNNPVYVLRERVLQIQHTHSIRAG